MICSNCGKPYTKGNAFHKLCLICNHRRLNKDKKPKPIKVKRKVTGEAEMFKKIWSERPHICANCGNPLGREAKTFYFSHIKPKSTHPQLRLDPSNIELLCFDCHDAYGNRGKDKFQSLSK